MLYPYYSDSPLDLKIKGNMLCDLFSLTGKLACFCQVCWRGHGRLYNVWICKCYPLKHQTDTCSNKVWMNTEVQWLVPSSEWYHTNVFTFSIVDHDDCKIFCDHFIYCVCIFMDKMKMIWWSNIDQCFPGLICHDPMMRTLQQSRRNQDVAKNLAARAKVTFLLYRSMQSHVWTSNVL